MAEHWTTLLTTLVWQACFNLLTSYYSMQWWLNNTVTTLLSWLIQHCWQHCSCWPAQHCSSLLTGRNYAVCFYVQIYSSIVIEHLTACSSELQVVHIRIIFTHHLIVHVQSTRSTVVSASHHLVMQSRHQTERYPYMYIKTTFLAKSKNCLPLTIYSIWYLPKVIFSKSFLLRAKSTVVCASALKITAEREREKKYWLERQ